jgi:signal transduction histidine kinase
MVIVATGSLLNANGARNSAARLYEARQQVARTQEQVGGSNLHDAVAAARNANGSAERVQTITERIAALMDATRRQAASIGSTSRRGVRTVVLTRRQAQAAADALAAISSYQRSASRSAAISNRALRRILRALRRTNNGFPGR